MHIVTGSTDRATRSCEIAAHGTLLYHSPDMSTVHARFYDCFTNTPGGGNPVALTTGADHLDAEAMQTIARDLGAPATCFLGTIEDDRIHARFFSPRTEYTMCGHAVIGLFTMLLAERRLPFRKRFSLVTPHGISPVYVESDEKSAPRVMLDLPIPQFRPFSPEATALDEILKIPLQAGPSQFPVLVAKADFVHLLVPLESRIDLSNAAPTFDRVADFCRANGIESIALFTLPEASVHNPYEIREFCPAIGVDESAAAGTTNASVSCYLAEQAALTFERPNTALTTAHQGATLGRPSIIQSEVSMEGRRAIAVRTGGTAVETAKPQPTR